MDSKGISPGQRIESVPEDAREDDDLHLGEAFGDDETIPIAAGFEIPKRHYLRMIQQHLGDMDEVLFEMYLPRLVSTRGKEWLWVGVVTHPELLDPCPEMSESFIRPADENDRLARISFAAVLHAQGVAALPLHAACMGCGHRVGRRRMYLASHSGRVIRIPEGAW